MAGPVRSDERLAKRDGLLDQLGRLLDRQGDGAGAETVTVREYLTVAAENGAGAGGNGTAPNTPVPGVPGVPPPPNGGMAGNKFEG